MEQLPKAKSVMPVMDPVRPELPVDLQADIDEVVKGFQVGALDDTDIASEVQRLCELAFRYGKR